jgi:hypothetical protein
MHPYNCDVSSLTQFRPTHGAHWKVRLHDHHRDASDVDRDYLTVVQYHEAAVTVDKQYCAGAPRMKATAREARDLGGRGGGNVGDRCAQARIGESKVAPDVCLERLSAEITAACWPSMIVVMPGSGGRSRAGAEATRMGGYHRRRGAGGRRIAEEPPIGRLRRRRQIRNAGASG